jgi:GT2 family glycosyltransferase
MEPVSIILKTWNAQRHVRLCLEYLLKNTSGEFELIIVDNGSRQKLVNSLSQLAESDLHVKLILNERNWGPGHANRQGFQAARHRLVCLMDSDVLVPSGWLGKLAVEMQGNTAIKMISPLKHEEGVIYPFDPQGKDSRQTWFETKRQYKDLSPWQMFLKFSGGMGLEEFDELVRRANPGQVEAITAPPDFLGTSCVLLDGDFVKKVGGVADPDFQGYGSEDVDLCWRIGAAGGLVAKSRAVYVHHFHGASLDDNQLDRRTALVFANQILYGNWRERLLDLALGKAGAGSQVLETYLESHFIFHQLAENTAFLHDLRQALDQAGISIEVPKELIWRAP